MAVPVDHTGDKRLALKIHYSGARTGSGHDISLFAHSQNRFTLHRDGFCDVVVLVHGENGAAHINTHRILGKSCQCR